MQDYRRICMTSVAYRLFSPIVSRLPVKLSIFILFFRRFHYLPDLKKPKSFNEKLQWRKLHDRNSLLTVIADKLASKQYVENKKLDIYIPKVLWEGENLNDLDFSKLPSRYVFKANHASRTNEFILNGQHLSIDTMEELRKKWFAHDQSITLGEWAYKDIKRKVFIEEYMDFNETVPDDYKFFVYHGKVQFIQLDTGRFQEHRRNMYDTNWNDLNIDYSYNRVIPSPIKPKFLGKMIEHAEELGKDFDFIRVDLYFYKEMITFGEFTVYPGAGYEKFPSQELDIEFGKNWYIQ